MCETGRTLHQTQFLLLSAVDCKLDFDFCKSSVTLTFFILQGNDLIVFQVDLNFGFISGIPNRRSVADITVVVDSLPATLSSYASDEVTKKQTAQGGTMSATTKWIESSAVPTQSMSSVYENAMTTVSSRMLISSENYLTEKLPPNGTVASATSSSVSGNAMTTATSRMSRSSCDISLSKLFLLVICFLCGGFII
jgi:hypothetical protein